MIIRGFEFEFLHCSSKQAAVFFFLMILSVNGMWNLMMIIHFYLVSRRLLAAIP